MGQAELGRPEFPRERRAALRPGRPPRHIGRAADAARTRLILLGAKGGPSRTPSTTRHLPAQVIIIRGVPYLIDCGLGVTGQFLAAGLALTQLRHIFITHHHSDYDLEYGNLFYTAWASGLTKQVDAWGPPPLAEMTRQFFALNKYDIDIRIADEGRPIHGDCCCHA